VNVTTTKQEKKTVNEKTTNKDVSVLATTILVELIKSGNLPELDDTQSLIEAAAASIKAAKKILQ